MRPVQRGAGCRAAVTVAALSATADNPCDGSRLEVDPADHVIFRVDDQHIAVTVEGHFLWRVKGRRERRTIVADIASGASAGDSSDGTGTSVDCPQCAALPLEDVDGSVDSYLYGASPMNSSLARRSAVAAMLRLAGAGKSPDDTRGQIDDAHPMVSDIGDKQPLLLGIERKAIGLDHPRARRGSIIAAKPRRAVAGKRRYHTGRAIDATNAMIVPVRDIDVSGHVHGDAVWLIKSGAGGGAAIPGIARRATTGDRRDHIGARVDTADAMIERVGEIEISLRIKAHIERAVQQSPGRRPAIAGVALLPRPHRCRNDPGLIRHSWLPRFLRIATDLSTRNETLKRRALDLVRLAFRAGDERGRIVSGRSLQPR